jgi:hypothetical protein
MNKISIFKPKKSSIATAPTLGDENADAKIEQNLPPSSKSKSYSSNVLYKTFEYIMPVRRLKVSIPESDKNMAHQSDDTRSDTINLSSNSSDSTTRKISIDSFDRNACDHFPQVVSDEELKQTLVSCFFSLFDTFKARES